MSAGLDGSGGPDFGSFLRRRGQDVLRFCQLLTANPGAARELARWSLGELGARWRPLVREYGDPETAVRVLAASRYLRGPELPAGDVPEPEPGEDAQVARGWDELRARPPADRAELVLRHWAELDGEALDAVLDPPRRSLLATLRTDPPAARLRRGWQRFTEPPDDRDHALIDGPNALIDGGPAGAPPEPGWLLPQVFRHGERHAPELDTELLADVEARASTLGRERRRRSRLTAGATAAAVLAVIGLGGLVREPPPPPAAAAGGAGATAPLTWREAWPRSDVTRFRDVLADGRDYRPLRFLDLRTAIGSINRVSGPSELLLVDVIARTARPLGTFDGVLDTAQTATDGTHIAWFARRGSDPAKGGQLWVAPIRGGEPRLLAAVSGSDFRERTPLVGMGEGRVYLVQARTLETASIELSSIPISGGQLRADRSLPGYLPVGWPWFSTIGNGSGARVTVRNAVTGVVLHGRLPRGSAFGACGRSWCVGSVAPSERKQPGQVYVARLDGGNRATVVLAAVESTPPLPVMVGRFVLVRGADDSTLLHDLRENRSVRMYGSVRVIVPSGRMLGWRVGGEVGGGRWRIADLRQLP